MSTWLTLGVFCFAYIITLEHGGTNYELIRKKYITKGN